MDAITVDNFKLTFQPNVSPNKISHGQKLLFLGSCFSDEISVKAKYHGFQIESNPFGTIFHPLALSRFIDQTLQPIQDERIVQRNDLFFSWDAGSLIYSLSETEIKNKIQQIRQAWLCKLKESDFLFITFGTAWGYKLKTTNELVANCHKIPSTNFVKELTLQKEIVESWNAVLIELRKLNPKLMIILTVSPVRHVADGLVENNRSKAILIDSVRQLVSENNCFYFPSYEIVIDELRDYRFFKVDRIHPNEEAINYVWNRFSDVFFTDKTIKLNKEIEKLRMSELHRSLYPLGYESKRNIKINKEKRIEFLKNNPSVIMD